MTGGSLESNYILQEQDPYCTSDEDFVAFCPVNMIEIVMHVFNLCLMSTNWL